MDFNTLVDIGLKVKHSYKKINQKDGHQSWTAAEYLQGFIGDVGDLTKLIMAKNNFRHNESIDEKLTHELADCLWSVIVLADELDIDLEHAYLDAMHQLQEKLDAETSSA